MLPDKRRDEDDRASMSVSIIVATHGDPKWSDLANGCAYPSARAQADVRPRTGVVLRHYPDYTLAQARNAAAAEAAGDWFCFLDADDELEPGYLDAMAAAKYLRNLAGPPPLLVPRVRRVYGPSNASAPEVPNKGGWPRVNECVIGTLVRADLFRAVGGFRDFTDRGRRILMYEDWDLWLRCWNSGAQLVYVHDAIYREHVAATGRNTNAHEAEKVYAAIWRDHEADRVVLGR